MILPYSPDLPTARYIRACEAGMQHIGVDAWHIRQRIRLELETNAGLVLRTGKATTSPSTAVFIRSGRIIRNLSHQIAVYSEVLAARVEKCPMDHFLAYGP